MISIANLRKAYGQRLAVADLTLDILPGEIFGLLGPNGAGKSTTVNLCCGVLSPDVGRIEVGSHGPPAQSAVRRRIGVAPQELAIYEELSAAENLLFFGKLYGLAGAALAARVDAVLRLVGLTDRRNDAAGTFSGGMKRRLNLAAALVHDPDCVILDEPTAGVDPQSRHALLEGVVALKKQGKTIIYTTHYMEEAQRVCDRVGIIDHGRLLALDTIDGLIRQHGGRSRVVTTHGDDEHQFETDDPLGELQRAQERGGLRDFRVERPSLEHVFLNLTGRSLRDA